MGYDKINFKDKTDSQAGTPLDASNMNHLEDGIAANADDIAQNTADISALNNDLANSDVLGMDGTVLNSGDDLNNCLDSEKYYSNSAAISGSLSNTPVTANAFSLFVVSLQRAGSRKMQILLDGAGNNIYFRSVTPSTSTWSSWKQVSTTTVTTTSISAPTSSFVDENGNVVEG